MPRRLTAAVLFLAISINMFGTALADPNTDDIVIRKGEQSDNVILMQMRLQDLGYYNYKITGFFGDFTKNALIDFQKTNNLKADGVAGAKTLDLMYGNAAKRNPVVDVNPPPVIKTKPKSKTYGQLIPWSIVSKYWKRGTDCKVIDLNSGKTYWMKRTGGVNHADVAPTDKKNNTVFEGTYGKYYPTWDRRAVVVQVGGLGWVAGSTNGFPHGSTGVPNNGMSQGGKLLQVCIHFLYSRGHASGMIDAAHQYQVYRAANKKYPGARSPNVFPGD